MPRTATSDDDLTLVAPVPESDRESTLSASDYASESDTSSLRRQLRSKRFVRIVSLIFATVTALCAGPILASRARCLAAGSQDLSGSGA